MWLKRCGRLSCLLLSVASVLSGSDQPSGNQALNFVLTGDECFRCVRGDGVSGVEVSNLVLKCFGHEGELSGFNC